MVSAVMRQQLHYSMARLDVRSLVRIYERNAEAVAQVSIDLSLKAGDTDTALLLDQARRAVVVLLAEPARPLGRSSH